MFALTNNPDMGARLCSDLIQRATCAKRGVDTMKALQYFAGALVEISFVFESPDVSMEAMLVKISEQVGYEPAGGVSLLPGTLPPAHIIDRETEIGRYIARQYMEDWLDCEFAFCDLLVILIQNTFSQWAEFGFHPAESLRLLAECTRRCMAYEIAAQELCDIVLDTKVAREKWGMPQCIAALSAVAGRRLAQSLETDVCHFFTGSDLPDHLDKVVYVMTQEAVRLGVPAGSDWRLGLAANDVPVSAPIDIIRGIEPYCHSFFAVIGVHEKFEQAVCCAKAAGRMLAVAAGGECPDMEPTIAKPLAMAAMTDTYKYVCLESRQVSLF